MRFFLFPVSQEARATLILEICSPDGTKEQRYDVPAGANIGKKNGCFFATPFCTKNDHLPRQARDRHREKLRNRDAFSHIIIAEEIVNHIDQQVSEIKTPLNFLPQLFLVRMMKR